MSQQIILGIDPGYDRMGVAVIKKHGEKSILVFSDCLASDKKADFPKRLFEIGQKLQTIIDTYNPTAVAMEKVFVTNNQKTAMMVGEIRGLIMYLSLSASLPIFDYTPMQIKSTVASHGQADKLQVISMVQKLIQIDKPIKHDDEYDAIAIALTCEARERF
jgi:crossover junction endodeoxyribonuclease RuvC